MTDWLSSAGANTVVQPPTQRPAYEPPRIQEMSEKDILNTFQITQSMSGWWTTGCC